MINDFRRLNVEQEIEEGKEYPVPAERAETECEDLGRNGSTLDDLVLYATQPLFPIIAVSPTGQCRY